MSSNSGTPEDDSFFWEAHKVSSVVIFSAIFIILTFYSIFHCLFYRTAPTSSSRNRTSSGDLDEPDPDDHYSRQIRGRGLELGVISALPMSQFKKNEGTNRECAICLGEFEEEEWVKRLPSCAHVFHVSCIATWLRSHSSCPLCRSNVNYDHLALNLDSPVSYYTSLRETLNREGSSVPRASQLGRQASTVQPISCSN
ncbi:E3 ubiquitin-protein ligase RING1-like [Neltuma alba]|uniref:E3 ubiquitin-protein ligase RING1-like n=1 Tax=Neltuma alba TaxID=207710 RepID=UPI0010A32A2F|nr:E3 ubiquitin-protein ligase RING1-like [Prosopis alba]